MRKHILYFAALLIGLIGIVSCEDNDIVKMNENVAPVTLNDLSSSSFVLLMENQADEFQKFTWSKDDYGFQASTTYTIQVAKAGQNFDGAENVISVNNKTDVSVSIKEFNDKLLSIGLTPDEQAEVDIRVVSTVNPKVPGIPSNVKTITVTPYATEFLPIYMVGDAVKGWNLTAAVEVQSEEFNVYNTIAYFNSGGAFRFFSEPDWEKTKWNFNDFTTISELLIQQPGSSDNNFQFEGESGYYKIIANGKTKTLTLESVAEPVLYMVGGAINGWEWAEGIPVKMTYIKPGVFEATTNFKKDIFRFFGQYGWDGVSYNYPFFSEVDGMFEENADDGDKNLRFVGEEGEYKITVDLNKKFVRIGDETFPPIFAVGAALNGWNWDNPITIDAVSSGVYKGTMTFTTQNETFRFFAQKDWNPNSYNYPYFTTVDPLFINAEDGDKNFKFLGEPGDYVITVNVNTKVVSVEQ
jgi:hypothetical protein